MKNFKRRLFEIIPGQPRAVLYIDSDILSVGCMDPFLATVGGADMAMFHDVYCPFGGCNEFCGGFIYMRDTPSTRQCIADWDAELRRDGYRFYRKDQDALDTVRRRGQCLGVRPYPYSMMQAVDAGFFYQMFDRYRLKRPIFQHFTHGIRQHQVWPATYDAIERQLAELMPSAWSPPLGLQAERRRRRRSGSTALTNSRCAEINKILTLRLLGQPSSRGRPRLEGPTQAPPALPGSPPSSPGAPPGVPRDHPLIEPPQESPHIIP